MKYKIVDNFLSEELHNNIKEVMTSDKINWFYSKSVSHNHSNDSYYFTHMFFDTIVGRSNYYSIIESLIPLIGVKFLVRVKGNMYPNTNKIFEHDQHVDYEFKTKGFIYYVNTNDGYTKLNDGTKIESIANRGLFFDPSLKHNSSTCTGDEPRINININYL